MCGNPLPIKSGRTENILFEYNGAAYQTDMSAYLTGKIILPDGTYLLARSWLDNKYPFKPLGFKKSVIDPSLLDSSQEQIAAHYDAAIAHCV